MIIDRLIKEMQDKGIRVDKIHRGNNKRQRGAKNGRK